MYFRRCFKIIVLWSQWTFLIFMPFFKNKIDFFIIIFPRITLCRAAKFYIRHSTVMWPVSWHIIIICEWISNGLTISFLSLVSLVALERVLLSKLIKNSKKWSIKYQCRKEYSTLKKSRQNGMNCHFIARGAVDSQINEVCLAQANEIFFFTSPPWNITYI
jgi:hypothetical protein